MHHLIREDGPLSHLNIRLQANGNRELSSEATRPPSGPCASDKDQEDAQAIASGVSAWKILIESASRGAQEQRGPTSTGARSSQDRVPLSRSVDESTPNQGSKEKSKCPFASLAELAPSGHEAFTSASSSAPKRPESLPTPPEWKEEFTRNHHVGGEPPVATSPPPSATGSTSKCPIRYLDERSPEEIARYFETHKHEIPRSHEVCVKRYQSNEESIRQLDAKYGNLVSMIQGLGVTHKPLLPTKEEEEHVEIERRSIEKVEKWAESVKSVPDNVSTLNANPNDDDREGHFDRPLEEIRVGESPSRPWGVRVPIEREVAPSASVSLGCSSGQGAERDDVSSLLPPMVHHTEPVQTADEGRQGPSSVSISLDRASGHGRSIENVRRVPDPAPEAPTGAASNKAEAPYLSPPVSEASQSHLPVPKTEQPRMVFTGPVFIGYPAEQAAELIKQCGMGVHIPNA